MCCRWLATSQSSVFLFLQNKEFVCRGYDYERLEDFQQRMLGEFPQAIAMQHPNIPDDTILQSDAQCILISFTNMFMLHSHGWKHVTEISQCVAHLLAFGCSVTHLSLKVHYRSNTELKTFQGRTAKASAHISSEDPVCSSSSANVLLCRTFSVTSLTLGF